MDMCAIKVFYQIKSNQINQMNVNFHRNKQDKIQIRGDFRVLIMMMATVYAKSKGITSRVSFQTLQTACFLSTLIHSPKPQNLFVPRSLSLMVLVKARRSPLISRHEAPNPDTSFDADKLSKSSLVILETQ
jgi:hypothetical protein